MAFPFERVALEPLDKTEVPTLGMRSQPLCGQRSGSTGPADQCKPCDMPLVEEKQPGGCPGFHGPLGGSGNHTTAKRGCHPSQSPFQQWHWAAYPVHRIADYVAN